jgi:hypothetical protein
MGISCPAGKTPEAAIRVMPIYEYYCPENHTIYQFYAKTLAQGGRTPKCPDNPKFQMRKIVSGFAITSGAKTGEAEPTGASATDAPEDARMDAAMGAMEKEFAGVDENDPRAMARMMRKMSELTGEKIDGEMEEIVRKLEEGVDPESLESQLGGGDEAGGDEGYGDEMGMGPGGEKGADPKEAKHRFKVRRTAPRKDPKLYDYE